MKIDDDKIHELITGQSKILVHLQKLEDGFFEIKKDLYGDTNTKGLLRECHENTTRHIGCVLKESQQQSLVTSRQFWMVFIISALALLVSVYPFVKKDKINEVDINAMISQNIINDPYQSNYNKGKK